MYFRNFRNSLNIQSIIYINIIILFIIMYNKYLEVISHNLTLEPKDWYFKRDKDYNAILEHVSEDYGNEYLKYINLEFNKIFNDNKTYIISLCEYNDTYGKTNKYNFKDFCITSPSNLRYIYHAFLILSKLKNNCNIIEIGGGYGGLCLFINKLSNLFAISINTYHIIDLPEISKLQKKYLKNINNTTTSSINDIPQLFTNSFLISNYGFSEFDKNIQDEYISKIIKPFVSNGFLVWNHSQFYKIIDKDFIIEKERPLTNTYTNDNLFITF